MKTYPGRIKLKEFVTSFLLSTLCLSIVFSVRAMDQARVETRTDLAVSTYGVSGQGVIVAILDRGIDWKNNDFRNSDGTTRIKYIFDLSDNTGAGAPGNTYGRGTIYTEQQINAALTGGPTLATRDAVGHGSTTAGIATGNGQNSLSGKYRGIAPNATIISVKVTSEGAPAHDAEPAEAAFNDATAYPVAIDFVRDKAMQMGMPAVMLLNLGSIQGPTDGTSSLARKIDATVGPGTPGLVFVNGTGDDGGMPNHAGGVVMQGGMAAIQVQKGDASLMRFDLWYGGNDRFDVSLQTPSGNFGPFASPPTNNDQSSVQNATVTYYHQGANLDFFGATNGKREILVDIAGPVGTYTIQLQGSSVTNGRFDATINPSNISQQPAAQSNRFLNFVVPGSIWDGATAHNNICPNDYVNRTAWTDIDGIPRLLTVQGNIGGLWLGTSVGPTLDGRLGVDVSAPGDSVFTVYNPASYWATFRFNKIQDGNGFYGRASATSAAAPIVTGIIALMLQKNPHLDAAQVKSMLQQSARSDTLTGVTPNPIWGYGKIDALNAVTLAAQSASTVKFSTNSQSVNETLNQTTSLDLVVTRAGDTSSVATIDYASADGTASERSDYQAALGTLHFAAGESSKTFLVFIVDDRFGEGPETFSVNLTNPVGCTLGTQTTFTVTINSNEAVDGLNPVRDASFNTDFFVRQHYVDFFNREPDAGGLAFWKDQIDSCTTQACRDIRKINVSAAFFLSIEFQQTGYLVERLYKSAYGNATGTSILGGTHQLSVPIVRLNEFLPDTQQIGRGVVIGQPGADLVLENNKQTLIGEFVQRQRFLTAYPISMTPTQFVTALNTNAGGVLSTAEFNQLVGDLTSGAKTRAQVLRAVAEDSDLFAAETNRAFVLAQFFGYLRRNPNDSPDSDYTGYDFWLGKLNQFNGNFVNAEMVKAFIVSGEYQQRFGP